VCDYKEEKEKREEKEDHALLPVRLLDTPLPSIFYFDPVSSYCVSRFFSLT